VLTICKTYVCCVCVGLDNKRYRLYFDVREFIANATSTCTYYSACVSTSPDNSYGEHACYPRLNITLPGHTSEIVTRIGLVWNFILFYFSNHIAIVKYIGDWFPHFCTCKLLDVIYGMIYVFNCKWVNTRWQQYSTHLHTNSTQNSTVKQNT
jgi:hypothetical protein